MTREELLIKALDAAHFFIDASDQELTDLNMTREEALLKARDLRDEANVSVAANLVNGDISIYQTDNAIDHLMHIIDRDRYVVAHGLTNIIGTLRGYSWLLEGRGPYEWNDDKYREEFSRVIEAIEKSLEPLRKVAWDKSDCTRIEERVVKAREAAANLLKQPIGPREMISADLFGDPRDNQIDKLKHEIAELVGIITTAKKLTTGQINDDQYVIKQRLDQTYRWLISSMERFASEFDK